MTGAELLFFAGMLAGVAFTLVALTTPDAIRCVRHIAHTIRTRRRPPPPAAHAATE